MLVWTACFVFCFFFSGLSIAWSRSSVSNDVFLHYFMKLYNYTLYVYTYIPLPMLLCWLSRFHYFFFSICLGWDWRYYTCIFLLGEWCSFDFSPFGAGWVGWKTCRDTWDVIIWCQNAPGPCHTKSNLPPLWRGPMIFVWRWHVYTLFGAFSANERLFGSHHTLCDWIKWWKCGGSLI